MLKLHFLMLALAACGDSAADRDIDAGVGQDARLEPTPPAGIAAWFPLNGLGDMSGNGFQIFTGGPFATFFGEGCFGSGAYMDGTSQYGLVRATAAAHTLDFPGAFTVALWVRPERAPTDVEVIASRSVGTGTESSFALVLDSTLKLRYDSQGGASLEGATPLSLGQWSFVALTYDGTTKRVFLDGLLDGSAPAAGPVTWDHEYIIFGADEESHPTIAGHHLKGGIDDIMLFDRALDASELASLAAP